MATLGKYSLPDGLSYERDSHLWLRPNGNHVTIGLDMLGQESMGDMAYIGLEPVGKIVQRGDAIGSLEAAKMVAPILAPISGRITARNDAIVHHPQLVNTSPYVDGWLVVIEPTRWNEESKMLLSGAQNVQRFLQAEIARYKEQGWIE